MKKKLKVGLSIIMRDNFFKKLKKTEYQNCWVAFLDILGYTKILTDENNVLKIKNIINVIFNKINTLIKDDKMFMDSNDEMQTSFNYTFFSDSIVISMSDDIFDFNNFIDKIREIIKSLFDMEIFIRGGISYGLLYHNNNICFGPALVDAYYLEKKSSVYPRVIIKDDLYNK